MRQLIRNLFPSMFHRRLLLLGVAMAVVAVALLVQLSVLTVVQAGKHRENAEAVLLSQQLIPTRRGNIYDRHGRLLARDRIAYDVAVNYAVLSGRWQYEQARRSAYRANKTQWRELPPSRIAQLIAEHRVPFDRQVAAMWALLEDLGAIDHAELLRRQNDIRLRVAQIRGSVLERRIEQREAELQEPVEAADVAQSIGEEFIAHAILRDVEDSVRAHVQRNIDAAAKDESFDQVWMQVEIQSSRKREYLNTAALLMVDRSSLPSPIRNDQPLEVEVEGMGAHLVGALRKIWKEDVDRRPFRRGEGREPDLGGYLPGDKTGRWGIEESMERVLRGKRGQRVVQLDTLRETTTPPTPGGDVHLTIDMALQARIAALMDPSVGLLKSQPWHRRPPPEGDMTYVQLGEPLNGAAVVLDVASGEVLAAVSLPSFTRQKLNENPQAVFDDVIDMPFTDRTVARNYNPGSTVKPIVLAAGTTEDKFAPGQTIECTGVLDPDQPNAARCWIYKHYGRTHGAMTGREAICVSCNIFFYRMGRRLGGPRLVWWYNQFGIGRHTQCGVPDFAGELPTLTQDVTAGTPGFTASDATFMAVGQGPIRWTPLQAAAAHATLARQGRYLSPTFIRNRGEIGEPRIEGDLHLHPGGVQMAMQGMDDSANTMSGTTHHLSQLEREVIFNVSDAVPGLRILAKSGTADAVPLRRDADGDGRITQRDPIVRRGDHGWCIAHVIKPGQTQPAYVIAVVVEYAGSGGAVSGPVANQIIHALRAEGYL